ncbi:hypothetical protein JCM10908_005834 [Rhodotorula pacifica]|uniref:uncharacterized protein n=1 Tax=Rhodotorula pacifica TaxID=1495444 RepID=UPI00317E3A84
MANLSVAAATSPPPPAQQASVAPYAQQPYPNTATSPLPAASPGLAPQGVPPHADYQGAQAHPQAYQYPQQGYAQPYPPQA